MTLQSQKCEPARLFPVAELTFCFSRKRFASFCKGMHKIWLAQDGEKLSEFRSYIKRGLRQKHVSEANPASGKKITRKPDAKNFLVSRD